MDLLTRNDGTDRLTWNFGTELPEYQKSADLTYMAAEATQRYDKFSAEDCYICISDKWRKTLEISWQLQSPYVFMSRSFSPKINFGFRYETYTAQGIPKHSTRTHFYLELEQKCSPPNPPNPQKENK